MANDKDKDKRFTVSGRQVVEFELLDDASKEALIKCINEKGRITLTFNEIGTIPETLEPGFRQIID
ncbi:hypothetical protein Q7L38_26525 [Pseudomonas protegens]|uniref:ApyA family aminopyruvatide-related RiPP n=1 Tax=Pseudomonas TaxID=286 RepID=UPI00275C4A04|nr:hypothetical protein [Pseudomonas protegens]MDP9536138.1 hypothetical protein [Pseudomonas protegens]